MKYLALFLLLILAACDTSGVDLRLVSADAQATVQAAEAERYILQIDRLFNVTGEPEDLETAYLGLLYTCGHAAEALHQIDDVKARAERAEAETKELIATVNKSWSKLLRA